MEMTAVIVVSFFTDTVMFWRGLKKQKVVPELLLSAVATRSRVSEDDMCAAQSEWFLLLVLRRHGSRNILFSCSAL